MATSRQLHILATNPHAYVRFATTGRLPEGVRPKGPLVELLKSLSPRDLVRIQGVTVDSRLGYTGSRRFHTAAQAMQWVAPADEVFEGFPAEQWRDKRFHRQLTVADLLACSEKFPEGLAAPAGKEKRPG